MLLSREGSNPFHFLFGQLLIDNDEVNFDILVWLEIKLGFNFLCLIFFPQLQFYLFTELIRTLSHFVAFVSHKNVKNKQLKIAVTQQQKYSFLHDVIYFFCTIRKLCFAVLFIFVNERKSSTKYDLSCRKKSRKRKFKKHLNVNVRRKTCLRIIT